MNFIFQYHFYKLQYVLHNNYDNSQALSGSNDLQKQLFHGSAHVRAAVPSGPLCFCFGIMATSGEPSTWLPLGKLEGQGPCPPSFSRKFEIFKKSHHFSTFSKSLAPIELWHFKVIFNIQYHFYKLQYVLHNYYDNSQALSKAMIFRNYFFMARRTVVQPSLLAGLATVSVLLFSSRGISCPSSYCFGITLLLERNLLPFELLLFSWRGISCPSSYSSSRKISALRIKSNTVARSS